MKTSVEWLKEYSEIDVTTKELADILTMTGTKVETIEEKGNNIKNVVIGKILEIEKHPDADKLMVTKVNTGKEVIQIVTGAKNISVGDIVPIALEGAELPGGVKIKKGNLRGIESCGMMCSIGELELTKEEYPEQVEDGIMILPKQMEESLGKDIVEVLHLREDILDFEITPNRPDCLSVEGIGRETAISLKKDFKHPHKKIDALKIEDKEEIEGLKVNITAPDLCYRYIARVVKKVKIQKSPEWMVRRLKACGVRSINNIVDITNYVMLEMGQPMHAFDINSIEGKHITVRRALEGEKIITLDEQERNLDPSMLVIADEKKAVALAGVMGGLNSEIEQDTQTVVFESAVFQGGNVRKTAKKVGLRTEASSRFEKGLSPENALRAVNRAIELVELLGAGEVVEGKIDVYPTKQEMKKVECNPNRINELLGIQVEKKEMMQILEKLEMKVKDNIVTVPYFRLDIEQEADLAEEILRFYGYDKLGSTLPTEESTIGIRTKQQKLEKELAHLMIYSGASEIYTYGFISEEDLKKCQLKKEEKTITIRNPLSEDYTIMRTTTIPSMMQILATNYAKKNTQVRLYDISRIYKNEYHTVEEGKVPTEEKILTIGMYGVGDFYTLKGFIENVLTVANISKYEVVEEKDKKVYHPGRCANIKVGNDTIITFGQIHPMVQENYDIRQEVYIAEVNITKLVKYSKTNKKYIPIPKFPAVERDIAMIVDETITVGEIEKMIQKQAKKMLEEVKLFDVYRDDKLGSDKKSVAYALKFRAENKTLTDEEINPVMQKIIETLEKEIGATLRK